MEEFLGNHYYILLATIEAGRWVFYSILFAVLLGVLKTLKDILVELRRK